MLRAALIASALAVLIGGCGVSSVEPDAGASDSDGGGGDGDASMPTSVLRFEFKSDPKVPGDVGGREEGTVDSLVIELEDVRAISDNASPTVAEVELEWGDDYSQDKIPVDFEDAPPGIYSRLRAQIEEISITGTVTVADEEFDYIINGEPQGVSVAIDLTAVTLSGTSMTTVPIEIDIRDVVRDVNWTALSQTAVNDTILLPAPEFDELAEHLAEAFAQDD
jgi:hypothetical protein